MNLRIRGRTTLLITWLLLTANAASAANADPFPKATPESQGLSSQSLAKLLDVTRGFVDKGEIVGGELMVIKNRRTVLHEAVGYGDLEAKKPLAVGTIYCIRSMTKPLAGAAVQMLIDEGRLSLDDKASRFLPSFDNDKSRDITVRQLLTHTGGLPLSTLLTRNFQELNSLREVVDISGTNGPTAPPGSKFQYSDDGTDTLAAILEVITGEPAEAFITKRVLEPLGMRDTFPLSRLAGDKLSRFTPAYSGSRANWMRFATPAKDPLYKYFLASQGAYSTTSDYARFLAMYLDDGRAGGKRLLSKAAVKRTLEPANDMKMPDGFSNVAAHYGQFMMNYVDTNQKKLVAFGHGGSDGTHAYAWPQHDLIVLFYTQSRGNTISTELESAIDRHLLGATDSTSVAQEMTAEAAAPYLGAYWLEPRQRPLIVVFETDRLALEIPWQGRAALKKENEAHVWSLVEAPENLLKFRRAGDEPATAFDLGGKNPMTLKRFEPEAGLPSPDELFALRPDRKRGENLASLGTIRLSGKVDMSVGNQKGSFDMLAAGYDRSALKLKVSAGESRQVVAGERAWMQQLASMPVQEMSPAMAGAARRNGWLLASGDWRKAFEQVRVLKRVDLDGKPVFMVHAVPAQGRHRLIYVDAANGLVHGYDEVAEIPGLGLIGCEIRFWDYRDIEGVQIPHGASAKFPTPILGTFTYVIEKVETRVKLPKDPFTIE